MPIERCSSTKPARLSTAIKFSRSARWTCTRKGTLKGSGMVATVMSNLGLELAMRKAGLEVCVPRSATATSSKRCCADNYNLGGEQSGHILFLDHNTTGDGAITCLQMLALMVEKRKRLSEMKSVMTRLPQVLLNVIVKEKKDFAQMPKVARRISPSRACSGRPRAFAGALLRHRIAGADHVGRRG